MELKILEQNENPLFKRKAITAVATSEIAPSNEEVKKQIADKTSSKPELVIIEGIHGSFGSKEFKITAKIYASEEDLKNTEPKAKEKKVGEGEATEAAPAAPAAAPEKPASADKPTPEVQPDNKEGPKE